MRDLAAGIRYLGQGQRWVARHGRWWGFGLIPALIALVLYGAVLTVLALFSGAIAAWATPFADGWGAPWQGLLRGLFVALLFAGALLLSVLTFTAVTLVIGDPFYESLSEQVEKDEGGCPEGPGRPLWREIWIALCDSVHVLLRAAGFGILLFALGFVPFLGQTVVLLFLIPFVAVVLMPGAVAGATLLVRDLLPADEQEPEEARVQAPQQGY